MTGPLRTETLRLLPWTSEDGKRCFLAGDGTGYVSRLADAVEAERLAAAEDLLAEAGETLAARAWTQGELHLLTVRLTESLGEVHRIAESRGARLRSADDEESADSGRDGEETGHDTRADGPRAPS